VLVLRALAVLAGDSDRASQAITTEAGSVEYLGRSEYREGSHS
jgi:hypothetical protein